VEAADQDLFEQHCRALDSRIARLEAQLAFVDLLLLPRIRDAAAAALAHLMIRSDQLPRSAVGFYPLEQTPSGIPFRWTEAGPGGHLYLPLVGGMRYSGLLTLLPAPHVAGAEQAMLTIGGHAVALCESTSRHPLILPFECEPALTGLTEIVISSASRLIPKQQNAKSSDTRELGVQFVSIEVIALDVAEPPPAQDVRDSSTSSAVQAN
jgi:hypothetical protein